MEDHLDFNPSRRTSFVDQIQSTSSPSHHQKLKFELPSTDSIQHINPAFNDKEYVHQEYVSSDYKPLEIQDITESVCDKRIETDDSDEKDQSFYYLNTPSFDNNIHNTRITSSRSKDSSRPYDQEKKQMNLVDRFRVKLTIPNELHRAILAEFFCTAFLLFGGCCVNAQFTLSSRRNNDWIGVTLGWGLVLMFAIIMGSRISGAHLNPAVSFFQLTQRKIDIVRFITFVIAQNVGAFVGSVGTFIMYYDAINQYDGGIRNVTGTTATAAIFSTYPAKYISTIGALVDQVDFKIKKTYRHFILIKEVNKYEVFSEVLRRKMLNDKAADREKMRNRYTQTSAYLKVASVQTTDRIDQIAIEEDHETSKSTNGLSNRKLYIYNTGE